MTLVTKKLAIGKVAQAREILLIFIAATFSFLLLATGPPWVHSGAAFTVIGFGAFLCVLLIVIWAASRRQPRNSAKTRLWLALMIWWSLLASREVFYRFTPESQSFAGNFSAAAYGAAAFWLLAFLAFLPLMLGSGFLRGAFSCSNKWLSLFALMCIITAPLSPTPAYSLAWAFKLVLVVLLLLVCSVSMYGTDDIEAFFWANCCGFAVLTVVPVIRAFADPSKAFVGGRLNAVLTSPTGLSASAGTLALLALILNSVRKRLSVTLFGILGVTVMIMAGGKMGILAGIASIALFFSLEKRFTEGFGWLFGVLIIGVVILLTTPLDTYFTAYVGKGEITSITGRTGLWMALWPGIFRHPFIGQGYLASRFISEHVAGSFAHAGHAHNGFMEALYNNGVVGLTLLVGLHVVTIKNLWRAGKGAANRNARVLTMGSWAIYANLFLNGLTNASFGGHAKGSFMLLLGLVVVSEVLRRNAQRYALRRSTSSLRQKIPFHIAGLSTQE